jgi:branched-chain amino acid transport system permease protein
MTTTARPSQGWLRAIMTGLIFGVVVVFIALVGMVEAFAGKGLIVGITSLAHTLLLIIGVANGAEATRRNPAGGPVAVLLRALLAGAAAGLVVAALIGLGTAVNLRNAFVNATPALFDLLSFARGRAGIPLVILAWAAAAAVGAVGYYVPAVIRRPLAVGAVTVIFAGLFQDLLAQLMQQEDIRGRIRTLLFDGSGPLSVRGALILFVVAAALSLASRRRRGGGWSARLAQLPPRQRRAAQGVIVLLVLAAAFYMPHVAGAFLSQVLVLVGLYTLMGLGLNLEVGFAGLLDLGFVAFFAIGAYTMGILTCECAQGIGHLSFWAALPFALLVSLIAGVLFGLPILGIRGDYLAIATLGFGEIIRLMVLSDALRPWLGGSRGVLDIPKPIAGGFEFAGPEQLFYLTVLGCALIAFVAMRLRDSRLGRAWMALREDEDVAEAMGINLINVKLLAYGIGGMFAGMGGAIFAVMLGSVFPFSFSIIVSINVLALIVVGGMGSLPGVVVGSLFLVGLPELLREFSDFRFLLYGAALIIMMQVRPEGLWPAAAQRRELHAAEAPAPAPAAVLPAAEKQVEA